MSPRSSGVRRLASAARRLFAGHQVSPQPAPGDTPTRPRSTGAVTAPSPLPNTPIYGCTWALEDSFGGMTNVLFHRAKHFAAADGRTVVILTFAAGQDSAAKERSLRDSGHLGEGVRLRNLWEDLADYADSELRALSRGSRAAEALPPLPSDVDSTTAEGGRARDHRDAASGTLLRREHLRTDGTTSVVDDHVGPKRSFTLFDRAGTALGRYLSARGLYFAWLDSVFGDEPSILMNDSKFAAGFLWAYRRGHVQTVHVHHSIHLSLGAGTRGPYPASRLTVLQNHEQFDLVTFLTERQLAEFEETGIDTRNCRVIPNSRSALPAPADSVRTLGSGASIARFSRDKRVDHQVEALALARRTGAEASLHVYGDGDERTNLETLVDQRGLTDSVTLHGFVQQAAAQLHRHDFMLFTSKYEGMGLVLLEAMAAGCIPISYDIRFGPSDIITDGVDGLLVKEQTPQALASALERYLALGEEQRTAMRLAARRRAAEFSDESVTRRWGLALAELPVVSEEERAPAKPGTITVTEIDSTGGSVRITARGELTAPARVRGLRLVPWSQALRAFVKVPVVATPQDDGTHLLHVELNSAQLGGRPGEPFDLFWEVAGAPWASRVPVSATQPIESAPRASGQISVGTTADRLQVTKVK